MRAASRQLFLVACLFLPGAARAEEPMSAIDWLSKSVATPASLPTLVPRPEPPVSSGRVPNTITVIPLAGPSAVTIGLVSAQRAGLPRDRRQAANH